MARTVSITRDLEKQLVLYNPYEHGLDSYTRTVLPEPAAIIICKNGSATSEE